MVRCTSGRRLLYGPLDDLTGRGWLTEIDESDRPEGVAGRERFYHLTASGRDALEAEADRLASPARIVRERLKSEGV